MTTAFKKRGGTRLIALAFSSIVGAAACAAAAAPRAPEVVSSPENGATGVEATTSAQSPALARPALSLTRPAPALAQLTRRPQRSALPHGDETDTPSDLPALDLTPQLMFQLLAAEIAAQRGEGGTATTTYLKLAQQTRDPRLARRATELAFAERSLERAMQGARLWRQLAPKSAMAEQALEALLVSSGLFAEAEPLVAQRLEAARADGALDAFYQQLANGLARAPAPAAALAMFDRISVRDAGLPEARLAAATLAASAGNGTRAAAEAVKALTLRPDDERTAVAAARLVRSTPSGAAGAERLLEGFLKRHPGSTEARFQYARLLAEDGRNDAARQQMELALRSDPQRPALLFSLAQLAYQAKQPQAAEDYLLRYLALPAAVNRDDAPAHLFLAQIEEDRGRPEQAIEQLAKVTEGELAMNALTRRAVLLGKTGRIDEARALLQAGEDATPRERTQRVLAESQVLREAAMPREAFDVLDRALQRAPDDTDLLYDHAMAAERIDRLDIAEAGFRRVIALRPDSAHAHNALGYTLADRNLRLDEAQALIERALQLAPEDPHIIDSMGWVLYRKGQYEQAVAWLERALKTRPEAEIAAHLGEVLWRMGRTDEARKAWSLARELDPENTTLKETLGRFDVKL